MKQWLIVLFSLTCSMAKAQYNPENVNRKAAQLYSKGMEMAREGQLSEAIEVLKQSLKIDTAFEDAYLSMAGMYGELKNYQAAIINYEKAKRIDSVYFIDFNLSYSINLAGIGDFQKALDAVNSFLQIPNLNESSTRAGSFRKRCYSFAVDYAAKLFNDYLQDLENVMNVKHAKSI